MCVRTRVCTHSHTTIPVGGGGSASYYQLIFVVFFFLQRRPYVSLSSTAFNLLLASAVKTSHLNCWFNTGTTGRHEGECCIVHTVYAAHYTVCVRHISVLNISVSQQDQSLTPSLKTEIFCLTTTNSSPVWQKNLSFVIFASFSKLKQESTCH